MSQIGDINIFRHGIGRSAGHAAVLTAIRLMHLRAHSESDLKDAGYSNAAMLSLSSSKRLFECGYPPRSACVALHRLSGLMNRWADCRLEGLRIRWRYWLGCRARGRAAMQRDSPGLARTTIENRRRVARMRGMNDVDFLLKYAP